MSPFTAQVLDCVFPMAIAPVQAIVGHCPAADPYPYPLLVKPTVIPFSSSAVSIAIRESLFKIYHSLGSSFPLALPLAFPTPAP